MRKVIFNKYVQIGVLGRKWQEDYPNEGMFLGWGIAMQDRNRLNYTVAMIELKDGTVEEVLPERMKFVNPSFIETDKSKIEPIVDDGGIEQIADRMVSESGRSIALSICDEDIAKAESEEEVNRIGKIKDAIKLHKYVDLWELKGDN